MGLQRKRKSTTVIKTEKNIIIVLREREFIDDVREPSKECS